jgi:hypothetical protein
MLLEVSRQIATWTTGGLAAWTEELTTETQRHRENKIDKHRERDRFMVTPWNCLLCVSVSLWLVLLVLLNIRRTAADLVGEKVTIR